jgi:hypothetical protein
MAWLIFGSNASGASAGSLCDAPGFSYTTMCYPPDRVKQVDRLLKVPALDPTRAVGKVTGLPLTEVAASKRVLPTPTRRVVVLSWLYGTFPPGSVGVPEPSPPLPKWAVVDEFATPFRGLKGVVVDQAPGTDGLPGSVPDWELQENLTHRSLGIQILTNEDRATTRRIGREIMKEAKQKGTK